MKAPNLERAADDAVVTVDERGLIRGLNPEGEALLGRSSEQVLGRPCYEVVGGRDVFGNRLCHENCAIQVMARRGEEIRPFNWVMQPGPGGERAARVSVTKVGADRRGRYTLVHAIHANGAGAERSPLRRAAAKAGLSAREQEVLSAVSRGLRNRDIAGELGISPATVRNHVQNITQKLGVRSKLEAMALVLRRASGDGRG